MERLVGIMGIGFARAYLPPRWPGASKAARRMLTDAQDARQPLGFR